MKEPERRSGSGGRLAARRSESDLGGFGPGFWADVAVADMGGWGLEVSFGFVREKRKLFSKGTTEVQREHSVLEKVRPILHLSRP